jgi:hypothetical protein
MRISVTKLWRGWIYRWCRLDNTFISPSPPQLVKTEKMNESESLRNTFKARGFKITDYDK